MDLLSVFKIIGGLFLQKKLSITIPLDPPKETEQSDDKKDEDEVK